VTDYQKMKQGVGQLLAELMRIKAEGDYDAIKKLVDTYGVRFDPKLRDQVITRYKTLKLPSYWAGINVAVTMPSGGGTPAAAYPRDAVRQYLQYAAMYDSSIKLPGAPAR
jgi:dipeptidyl-peptidase-3